MTGPTDPETERDGVIVTIFRSRPRHEAAAEYEAEAERLGALARTMPGFVEIKRFDAPDGERVSIVTFADRATHDAWRHHPEHRRAQQAGRDRYYATYDITVCERVGHRHFEA